MAGHSVQASYKRVPQLGQLSSARAEAPGTAGAPPAEREASAPKTPRALGTGESLKAHTGQVFPM